MVNWTNEQHKAIYTDGSDVLVAAAAGSGKTAVLVERIIQKLIKQDNPVDIDTLLVVTFTNAAAQEMRNRVGLALERALAENPASNHLKKQLSLLQRASISTLHSFCLDVVKQYAYLLDIDPGFRIANDMEADLIKQEVIADLFEEWYGKEGDEQGHFFAVVDRFSSDRSDIDVENLVLDLYTFAMQNPYPERWLDRLAETYDVKDGWTEAKLPWLSIMKREVSSQLAAMKEETSLALGLTRENDGPYHYAEAIAADLANLEEALAQLESWDNLQAYMQQSTFANLSRKKVDCDETKKNKVKMLRDSYKKRWNDMKQNWFTRDLSGHIADMRELAPVIKQLTELVKQFKVRFTEQKREKAIVDFSDLEHYCLELLSDTSMGNDYPVPSTVANHFKKQFTEVLVDEYQDTNLVQETILSLISDQDGSGNMFMVGDVKQSIYRFRHAEPSLFIDKYKRFAQPETNGLRIDLASNFRSREQVLIGANYIFRQILDENVGEINYDQDAELIYANHMYDSLDFQESEPELLIIDREAPEENETQEDEPENYQDLEKAQLEARAYAEKIKGWIGQKDNPPLKVVDKATQTQRGIQYRDVVILLRSMTWAPTIVDELKKQGIPVYAELSTGYFEAIEVKIMLSFLKVIDNPRQDIPLASILRSPIVGLNEEELARIRLADRRHTYYDALKKFNRQETGETAVKINNFLEQLKRFRVASRQGALSELIWQIYRETGYYDFVGGMPGGRQRQANLRALYDRARGYETTSFRGLFRFLRFIERMEERGEDLGAARALSEQEDVVRIMTIHKSKGLEFPVVILGAMDKQFNMQDLKQRYLLHKDLGFASKYIDPVKRITYPTLLFHAFQKEKLRELLAEEMRVLYVALTRAKEKLVMVANVASFEKKQAKWQKMIDHGEWVLPAHYRMEAKTYLDWVGPALLRHQKNAALRTEELSDAVLDEIKVDPSAWNVSIVHGSEYANLDEVKVEADAKLKENIIEWQPLLLADAGLTEAVNRRLSFQYPFQQAQTARAKQTVTEIKRQREIKDEYSDEQLVQTFQAPIVTRPKFMQQEQTISAAERGTVMHTVMQHIPLDKALAAEEVEEFAEILVEKEILTNDKAAVIDFSAIAQFFTTEIGKYMLSTPELYREVPFSLSLPASQVYPDWSSETDEHVLVQGVIDCIIPKDDGWIILDYKTDAIDGEVTEQVTSKLKKRYMTQMNLYRQAIETIWHQPVKETYLYFFAKQLVVKVPDATGE
ncbi:ATP-dependent helicase/nuclease subunit A [Lentibacillus populi]|uniref:ATP-dependent helicase/nuclease subunit A n=1 Tax=Lentibacillus populi TaxID=1827502 RepID=A0A9W5X5I7_9BACI|nr:helicase-exonuclease AddAB subunit AddA [Lentibacillus populi]MBT2215358.1 helicase-exonuclease AddAB subunit AddA [Virgibacillus dakarensis]GGB39543.1 ATP-dependent helicase/nuclease subunit A [Lentibacillus populi]